ncbi:hypothetical protein CYMTET_12866 [Cymbomonas tetramitiformis]|uniref:Uncharacterized protein n=1 Tax=Cymbomonas tetramitiformis TaxID=36881 RepID=A0AAE0GJL6_9CHLO|nr:hypothetical protein CYMTET_12866 [Cymbomonas tetramitiformis]
MSGKRTVWEAFKLGGEGASHRRLSQSWNSTAGTKSRANKKRSAHGGSAFIECPVCFKEIFRSLAQQHVEKCTGAKTGTPEHPSTKDSSGNCWSAEVELKEKGGKVKTTLKLTTNVPTASEPLPPEATAGSPGSPTAHLSASLLKSALQKNVRLCRVPAAVRSALHLLAVDPQEALRRLAIIVLEDATLHPSFPVITWLTAAYAKGYRLSGVHLAAVLQLVHEIAVVGWRDPLASASTSDSSPATTFADVDAEGKEQIQQLECVRARAVGGIGGDSASGLAENGSSSSEWFQFIEKLYAPHAVASREILRSDLSALQLMQALLPLQQTDVPLSAVDFHCTNICDDLVSTTPIKSALEAAFPISEGEEKFRQAMWVFRSSLNKKMALDACKSGETNRSEDNNALESFWRAVRSALHLLAVDPQEALRRLAIIVLEDATLHPSFPVITWLTAAYAKGYRLSGVHLAAVLQLVHEIAVVGWRDPLASASTSDSSPATTFADVDAEGKEQIQQLECVRARAVGGIGGDSASGLAENGSSSSEWFQFIEKLYAPHAVASREILRSDLSALQLMQALLPLQQTDVPLSAVDFHCTNICDDLVSTTPIKSALEAAFPISEGEEKFRQAMWVFRSSLNKKMALDACKSGETNRSEDNNALESFWRAVRSALHLLAVDPQEALRRLAIIVLEDATLHPSFPVITWLTAAYAKGYRLSGVHLAAVLQLVHEIAVVGWRDPLASASTSDSSPATTFADVDAEGKEQIQQLECVRARAVGGIGGDSASGLAENGSSSSEWFQFIEKLYAPHAVASREILRSDLSALQLMQALLPLQQTDVPLSAVDFHCTNICDDLVSTTPIKSALEAAFPISEGEEKFRQAMWVFRSSLNKKMALDACKSGETNRSEDNNALESFWRAVCVHVDRVDNSYIPKQGKWLHLQDGAIYYN